MGESEVGQYTERIRKLRSEGRLEEAILVARKATQLDEYDANVWWLLAVSLRDRDDLKAALHALRKVTELAPGFPPGWCELGKALQEAGRTEEAIEAYEESLNLDAEHVPSLRMLASALRGRNDAPTLRRRLALLSKVQELNAPLDKLEQFDFAYLLGEAKNYAQAARAYEAYTRQYIDAGAYFNLALAYEQLGRNADAYDALTQAQRIDPQREKINTTTYRIAAKLRTVRESVLQLPQPYLPEDDWYEHYINPFALLNVTPSDVREPKARQKAKQALLREIDLEEGKVSWMPGLVLDKSNALAQLEVLDDEEAYEAHELVFDYKYLRDFLERGGLGHFLIQENGVRLVTLPHEIDPPVLRVIGPSFALQYSKVLTRAFERGEIDVVKCLLDGRRVVLPEQEEQCYEGSRRVLERFREPLTELVSQARQRVVTRKEVQAAMGEGALWRLVRMLPMEFHETYFAVGRALRELAVLHYNHEQDAREARAILHMAKDCAEKLPSLAHQLAEDEKWLSNAIAEERSKEAHLQFGQTKLDITKAGVVHGGKTFAAADIDAVRWGLAQTSTGPNTVRHTIAFRHRDGQEIVVSWTTSQNLEQQTEHWHALVNASLHFVVPALLADMMKRLGTGQSLRVGPLDVVRDGVIFDVPGWFSTKRVLTPWVNLQARLANGQVLLQDARSSKARASLPLETTYNAVVLHMLASTKESSGS